MIKYVFVQDDPFFLPQLLDKFLREFADSTVGINVQSVAQGKRTVWETARELLRMYGLRYFVWKLRHYGVLRVKAKLLNDLLGSSKRCYSVAAVARKYGLEVTRAVDVNSEAFRRHLAAHNVALIVSMSGTQLYRRKLREQTPAGIINCHGGLLPRYRGLMPSFWTLANGETVGGVSVHFVDDKLDSGPILVQRTYRIYKWDTLEDVMARSKDLAAEAVIEAVRIIEAGDPPTQPNDASLATSFSLPTREDVARFLASGHRFY
jgi:methionyl-tRNA formyltransferase